MSNISFIIATDGESDSRIEEIITSIELLEIPKYEILIVGGKKTSIKRSKVLHVPFEETTATPWLTKKKNLGVKLSNYEISIVMHDYFTFDQNWYSEFLKFGTDWDFCVQQHFIQPEWGGYRYNGWRVNNIPTYPEIHYNLAIPWDIDCFIPYMDIHGSYYCVKKDIMIKYPLDENLLYGQLDDVNWSSRVVPGWRGHSTQPGIKIVANPNCVSRLNKKKLVGPCGPDNIEIVNSLSHIWDELRSGYIRPGTVYYDSSSQEVKIA